MKLTIVPAQVTTVEDKVAGNLSLTQLVLVAAPVFICGVLYGVLPMPFQPTIYKLILMIIIAFICDSLAIRLKGRLILDWVLLLSRYNSRPRFYVANKNDAYLRVIHQRDTTAASLNYEVIPKDIIIPMRRLSDSQRRQFEQILSSDGTSLVFNRAKKGGSRVSLSQIK